MKLASLLYLAVATLLAVSAPAAHAQRETFNASVFRIIESKAITEKLSRARPEKTVQRTGAGVDGKTQVIVAYQSFVTFDDVFFQLDSTKLRNKESEAQLQEMLKALQSDALKGKRFLIEGHTCDLGETAYNLTLSAARAQTIKDYLMKRGVAPERLAILGCGEAEPEFRLTKSTPAEIEVQRERNRRVVLREMPAPSASKNRNK